MQQVISKLLKANAYAIAVLITIAILYLSLAKIKSPIKLDINYLDKWQHCLAYFTLTISWLFALRHYNKKTVIVVACIILGIVIEVLQKTLTNYRSAEYLDMAANSVGVFLGLLIYNRFSKKNN